MNSLSVYRTRYEFAHELFYQNAWAEYSEAQMRCRPHGGLNSLAWNHWHVARVEDAGVSRLVLQRPQLLDKEGWAEQLGVPYLDYGYGMTREEMAHLSETINLDALRRYHEAVRRQTLDLLDVIAPQTLSQTVGDEEMHGVLREESFAHPRVYHVEETYAGWTRHECLHHFSLLHYYRHGGEVRTLGSLL